MATAGLGPLINELLRGQQRPPARDSCTFADDAACYGDFPFDPRTRSMHKLGNNRAVQYRVNRATYDRSNELNKGVRACDESTASGSCRFNDQIPQVLESQPLYDAQGRQLGPLDGRTASGSATRGLVRFEKRQREYSGEFPQGKNVGVRRKIDFMRESQALGRQCESMDSMCGNMNLGIRTGGLVAGDDTLVRYRRDAANQKPMSYGLED